MHWEKTIEYLFIARFLGQESNFFAAPLAGKQERGAGDAIAGGSNSLFLIEFKSTDKELDSEQDKFHDYKKAKELLNNLDSHHLFVYGDWNDETLGLEARTYFSRQRHEWLLREGGADKIRFERYLAQLLSFKKRDGRSTEGIRVSDYASVIGITSQGKFAGSVSLADYVADAFPELFQAFTLKAEPQNESYRGPRLG